MNNGKPNGNGRNGHGRYDDTEVIPDYLYTKKKNREEEQVKSDAVDQNPSWPTELPPSSSSSKSNPKKKAIKFIVSIMVIISVALGLYLYFGGTKKLTYDVVEQKKKKPQNQSVTGIDDTSPNQATKEAIRQAQEALSQGGVLPDPVPSPGVTAQSDDVKTNEQTNSPAVFTPYTLPDYTVQNTQTPRTSSVENAEDDGDRNSAGGGGRGTGTSTKGQKFSNAASNSVTRSIYVGRKDSELAFGRALSSSVSNKVVIDTVPVPPFGTRLPARSIGAIFTLRDGGLAQFELPMDVKGNGWALRRGTVLVARTQGSMTDRAFLNLVGFINPATNRLVRLSGEIQGADGAVGLKGKRRRINSRFASVMNRVANGGLALGQAALNRGGTTIIMGGGSGFGGEFGLSANAISRREFVEIQAGTPAFILINDLPNELKGIDSNPTQFLSDEPLSDEELADLLEKGNTEEIRAAFPRMSPDMKKLVKVMLGERGQ